METAERLPRPRRSRAQRLLIACNCVLIAACLTGVGFVGYLYHRVGDIPRLDLGGDVQPEPADPGGPKNFLLVGSDTRVGQDASFGSAEEVGQPRADTVILVRIDPREERAAMVSFPRDLWVDVYDADGELVGPQRINTAFGGGPKALINTISENFDIPIHHYAQVNFAGFQDLVEAVGGVDIYLPGPVRDRDASGGSPSGLDIPDVPPTGACITLTGDQALAYVRSRHFEQFVDGEWQIDRTGDLGRIQRQQDFIRRAVREALSEGLTNPVKMSQLLDVAEDNMAIDGRLGNDDIVNIGQRFQDLSPETLDQRTLAVEHVTKPSGAQVLELADDPVNEQTFDVFRGVERQPGEVSPTSVEVRVLNGTGTTGQAGAASEALDEAGFTVVGVGDGPVGTPVTTVRYAAGQEAEAQLVARHLASPGAQLVPDDELTVEVVVTTGADYTGVLEQPRPADAAPAPPDDPPVETTAAAPEPAPGAGDEEAPPPAPEC